MKPIATYDYDPNSMVFHHKITFHIEGHTMRSVWFSNKELFALKNLVKELYTEDLYKKP